MNIVDLEETRAYDDSNEIQTKLDPVDFLKPNLFFDPQRGAFKGTTKGYQSPDDSLTG